MLKAVVASQKKLHKMEKVYFESLPTITVASHRTIIPSFEDLGRLCYEVIGPEYEVRLDDNSDDVQISDVDVL